MILERPSHWPRAWAGKRWKYFSEEELFAAWSTLAIYRLTERGEMIAFYEALGAKCSSEKIVDRALQRLKKAGLIIYSHQAELWGRTSKKNKKND